MTFDEVPDAEWEKARAAMSSAGLESARLTVTRWLIESLGVDLPTPGVVKDVLMARDGSATHWELLSQFEARWALLVARLAAGVMDPVDAVADARRRGCSWAMVGTALGVSAQGARQRFVDRMDTE